MKSKITISNVVKFTRRLISAVLFYSSLLFLIVLFLLQLDTIQTFIAEKVLAVLSEKSNHTISLQKVKITWLDKATLEDFLILDVQNDTMFYAQDLSINYEILDLLHREYLTIEEVISENVYLNLVRYDIESDFNLSDFVSSLKKDSTGNKRVKPISIDDISINELIFRINDKSKDRISTHTDFSHLDFQIPMIVLEDFHLRSDTIQGNIIHFSGNDLNSGLVVNEFRSLFRLSNSFLSLDNLDFRTPNSSISDSLEFFYHGLDDFGSFKDSVSFVLHFSDSKISHKDIEIVTGFSQLKSEISLDGIFWGTVGDFNIEEARIGLGNSTFLEGGVSCFGLPDPEKTFLLADVTHSHLVPSDLEPYVGEITDNLRRMGKIDFTGSFAGFLNDFVAKGDFHTDQGMVHSDINLKIPNNASLMSYKGNLELIDLNIGSFLQNDVVQRVNLVASINGKGITPDNADFNVEALITNSSLRHYVYDSVYINGHFKKNFFKSELAIIDPNCVLKGYAELDMRDSNEYTDIEIVVDKLLADTLNLTSRDIAVKGRIDLVLNNFAMDRFEGELKIDSGFFELDSHIIPLDSIRLLSWFQEDSSRQIKISAPGISSLISGDFLISDLMRDIPILTRRYAYRLHLLDSMVIDSSLIFTEGSYNKLNAKVELKNAMPYMDSLKIPIVISRGSVLEFSYRNSKSSNISLFYEADSINIYGHSFKNPILEINGSSDENMDQVLTNFIFKSSGQKIKGIPETKALLLEGVWFDNRIEFSTLVEQPSSSSEVRIESQLQLQKDSLVFKVLPSDIFILSDQWKFNPANSVVFKQDKTIINNLEIFDQNESIRLSGIISALDSSWINILIEDLNMDKANLFTESKVEGYLNGNFNVFSRNEDESKRIDGGFFLKNLKYDGILVGDVSGSSNWNPETKSIFSKMEVIRDEFKSIEVMGSYFPSNQLNQLDFDITFDQADLIIARPFVNNNFSQLHGSATGLVKLAGTSVKPTLSGSFKVNNGGGIVNYLNTEYAFSGEVAFDQNIISIPNFNIVDRKGSNAVLSGTIAHNYFTAITTNLTIQASNFEFLNTTSLDNSLYYGSAYGSGKIDISGPINDLSIKAVVLTDPNTRVFIPVSETANATQENYVQFVNFSDSTLNATEDLSSVIKGLTLDFDIEVTPDAYCELIFDIKKGDIIRGRGRGNLKLLLNSDGEFSMFGPLEIVDGAYNFTLSNLINKEFEVIPGSRVVWYGDPYNATLDLQATYIQRASFEELKNEGDRIESEVSKKIPVLAVLNMSGGMLAPAIDFDIRLQNESDANNDIVGTLSRISNDEQELRRQFISLLFLRRFSPFDSFSLGSGGGLEGSVSEILSNQVSYLVSQIDENLEIEVDLASLDEQAFNTFQLRFAYTLLDGRLKLTRGGSFGTNAQQSQNTVNSIVGDWSVEYSLTTDGRLRAKVFQNTSNRLVNFNSGNLALETGFSLRFVHSFNDLSELLTSSRREGIRRKEEEEKRNANNTNLNSGSN